MPDVTTMVVKVNLKCEKNKKKIKKVLCKIPEIENQVYDEKNNSVTITVVCCCPEKIKKKIFCKGGCIIIDIVPPPPKPKPDPKPEPAPKNCCSECSKGYWGGPCHQGYIRPPPLCYYPYCGYYGWPMCDCWGSGCRKC